MPGRVRAVTLLIGAASAGLAQAQAQTFECAALKPSTSSSPAYRAVPGQARCEGFFEKTVSQPFIELVSLTRGPAPVSGAAASSTLEIRADVRGPARLVIQPQTSTPYYRVDAAMQGGQPLLWDAAPMLAATPVPLASLGFLALTGPAVPSAGAPPALAPLAFTAQALKDTRVYAVVRVSVEVSSVAWRAYRTGADAGAATATAAAWTDMPNSHLYAWKRITLPIDLPADGHGLRVDVQAVGASNAQTLPLLRFVVVGPRDGN